ncbi:MAG: divalent metal cation transporter [Acidobacteriota bacterium]
MSADASSPEQASAPRQGGHLAPEPPRWRRRLGAILFWSVLSAAFIGPGTVTTAAAAGAAYGHQLLWALAFSTLACAILQEASARLTTASGLDLAQALGRQRQPGSGSSSQGLRGAWAGIGAVLVLGAVVLGCAAYEAGNLLGATAGVSLALPAIPPEAVALLLTAGAALALWGGQPKLLARGLGGVVAVMGVAFGVVAFGLRPELGELLRGLGRPTWPADAGLLILGLVGTTVVPYNLFLGSGLARRPAPAEATTDPNAEAITEATGEPSQGNSATLDQDLAEQRLAIALAVGLGGIVSMTVLITGTAVAGEFSFEALAAVLEQRLGAAGRWLLALGLFAAGLSSAITAPLAAALAARGVSGPLRPAANSRWGLRGGAFRATWLLVLLTGTLCAVSGLRPIPVILAAQAFNGLLLPVAALFLVLTLNDRRTVPASGLNGPLANLAQGSVTAVALLLGLRQLALAATAVGWIQPMRPDQLMQLAAALTAILAIPVFWRATALRRGPGAP